MKNVQLKLPECNFDLTFEYPINLISGLSSTGKTTLANKLRTKANHIICKYPVYSNIDVLMLDVLPKDSIVFIDMDNTLDSTIVDSIAKYKRTDVTFVLLGRKWKARIPIAVQATFELRTVKGITRNFPICEPTFYKISKFSKVYTEDSMSGKKFFESIFPSVYTTGGKDKVFDYLSKDNLLVFDGVGFGANIEEFLELVNYSNTECAYICWHSFEHFILENVFHDTGKLPIAVNIEDALVKRLQEYNPHYSKNMGCTGDACKHCKLNCYKSSTAVFRKSQYSVFLNYLVESSYTKEDIEWCRNMCPDVDKELPDSDIWSKYGDMCKKYKT